MSSLAHIKNMPRWLLLMASLGVSLFIGGLDYVTGDFSLMVLYLIPIFCASWFIGLRASLFISIFCGVELFVTNLLVAPGGGSFASIRSWNSLMEGVLLVIAGYLFSTLKVELEQKQKRAAELEAANRELEAFNYSVTHDLRKPLTVINGYCEVILHRYRERLDSQCLSYIGEISAATLEMDSLIDSLLEFSRLSHAEPHWETVDLSRTAQMVVAGLRMAELERRVTVEIDEGITARGDRELLRVVLANLLGNAWKYTGKREDAVIGFGVRDLGGKPAYFVRDNGAGFDMADAERLFLPFQRLHGSDDFKGHGIGLATVERIIRRHGGRVWAEGEPGNGATFYFTL